MENTVEHLPWVNIFIAREQGGTALLWQQVPVDTAKRLCSRKDTAGNRSMMVWSESDQLGLHPGNPIVDAGRYDHLLTDEELETILYYDGYDWRTKG